LIDHLSAASGEFEVALAASPERGQLQEHRLALSTERFSPLPTMQSLARGFWKASGCRRVIADLEARTDALIIQLPFAAPLALLGARGPRLYHVCADILQQARSAGGYSGLKRIPALGIGTFIDHLQGRLIRGRSSRAVTHGKHLENHYRGRGRAVVSSALLEKEILSVARQRPRDAPFRVLFVGYFRHEKGIGTLLQAFEQVVREIPDAELVLVGGRDMVDTGVDRLLADLDIETRKSLQQVGPLPFGQQLFQQFADADVLVLPSLSEGTPRVLIEARGFGCPVIASRVGGIPTSIEDHVDGLLFEPGDAAQLAQKILSIARDRVLHERLVQGGLERARRTTVERFADSILEELETLIEESPGTRQLASQEG